MATEEHKGLPLVPFATSAKLRRWFDRRHDKAPGLWVKFAKKSSGLRSVTYEEARDAALCYGWVDGLKNALDETHYAIRFTPRRPKSKWSEFNRAVVEKLIARGEMKQAGLREVEAAKADGRWAAAYPSSSTAAVPADLDKALSKNKKAREFFATVTRANRYAILYRVAEAKKPETRAARIAKFVAMLERGEVIHGVLATKKKTSKAKAAK